MKQLLICSLLVFSLKTLAWEAPEILEDACYDGCTIQMQQMYEKYLNTQTPPMNRPGMYSGECHHLSRSLDPETTHYIGLLIDIDKTQMTMSPILQYFGEENDMKDWSLAKARKEMSGEWKSNGHFQLHPTSLTSHYEDEDGYPVIVYWARQDWKTKEIYFMAYLRSWSIAFCTARPNPNGF